MFYITFINNKNKRQRKEFMDIGFAINWCLQNVPDFKIGMLRLVKSYND